MPYKLILGQSERASSIQAKIASIHKEAEEDIARIISELKLSLSGSLPSAQSDDQAEDNGEQAPFLLSVEDAARLGSERLDLIHSQELQLVSRVAALCVELVRHKKEGKFRNSL